MYQSFGAAVLEEATLRVTRRHYMRNKYILPFPLVPRSSRPALSRPPPHCSPLNQMSSRTTALFASNPSLRRPTRGSTSPQPRTRYDSYHRELLGHTGPRCAFHHHTSRGSNFTRRGTPFRVIARVTINSRGLRRCFSPKNTVPHCAYTPTRAAAPLAPSYYLNG